MVVYTLEQRWEILRQIDLQKMTILARKKIIFTDEAYFDLGEYVNSKIVAFEAQKTRTHTLKSRRTQNESQVGPDFGPETYLGHFSSKMSKDRSLQSMAIVIWP